MSFSRYPSYKDSGVEWLGDVPEHWDVQPLYSSVVERDEPNKGMVEDNLLSLSYGRIVQKDITSNDGLLPESFETYQVVRPGDIVFRLTDLQNDKRSLRSAIVEETGIITSAYLAVVPRGPDSKYMSYLFRAYDVTKVFYSMGGGLRQSMKFADLKRMPTLLPPPEEQTQIAAFLDRETAKIDELVAEQRRLMELLKEKRQAVISHAVTQGLNPNVPMKPSGIEWLGDVPVHWRVGNARWLTCRYSGGTPDKTNLAYWEDGTIPWLNSGAVNDRLIATPSTYITAEAFANSSAKWIPEGALVMALAGQGKTKGMVAQLAISSTCNQSMAAIIPGPEIVARFLFWWLDSNYQNIRNMAGGDLRDGLNLELLGNIQCPLAPLSEQTQIAAFLDRETTKMDGLVAEAQRAIELLQERRTALISAAVTGQIDVRNSTTHLEAA